MPAPAIIIRADSKQEDAMKKFFIGLVIGAVVAFPLGINFGKDVPLFSNPFAAKPDITERVKERTEEMLKDTKEAIHEATKPAREKLSK
jgi:gas vesicle protein